MKRQRIKHVIQPPGSRLCGQCVVAMAAGISLEKAIQIVGHERGTRGVHLVRALRKAGVKVSDRLSPFVRTGRVPPRCVMRVRLENEERVWSHWILRWDDRDYDPSDRGRAYWLGLKPRLVSYLKIG